MAIMTRENLKLDRLNRFEPNLKSFNLDSIEHSMTTRLDQFEGRLPAPADTFFRLQRALAGTTYAVAKQATGSVAEATGAIMRQARSSSRRVATTARTQADNVQADMGRVAEATKTGVKDIADRVEQATEEVTDEIKEIGDEAVNYGNWTKEELYDRAQDMDIPGRSAMSKDELIDAIRTAK